MKIDTVVYCDMPEMECCRLVKVHLFILPLYCISDNNKKKTNEKAYKYKILFVTKKKVFFFTYIQMN